MPSFESSDRRPARTARRRSTRRRPTSRSSRRAAPRSTAARARRPTARSTPACSSATSRANARGDVVDDANLCREASTSAILPASWTATTVDVYETAASTTGSSTGAGPVARLARRVRRAGPARRAALDLGCGPGWHSGRARHAGRRVRRRARRCSTWSRDVRARRVAASSPTSKQLPFRTRRARRRRGRTSRYMHIAGRAAADGARRRCTARCRSAARCTCRSPPTASRRTPTTASPAGTSRGGRPSACATSSRAPASTIDAFVDDGEEWIDVEATRARTLRRHRRARHAPARRRPEPERVLGRRRASASPGPGNRFWPAALASGLVTRTHDPVARAARRRRRHDQPRAPRDARADELVTRRVRRRARARLERLVRVAATRVRVLRRLTGYRVAVDKRAAARLASASRSAARATYVMPNTSGLNAHAKPADFAEHLRTQSSPRPA